MVRAEYPSSGRPLNSSFAVNSTAEQRTRLLEAKVIENTETIEQLRQERSVLVSDYKDLQKQFGDVVKVRHANFPPSVLIDTRSAATQQSARATRCFSNFS